MDMQTNRNAKTLLEMCIRQLRIFADTISSSIIDLLAVSEEGFPSDVVLDAEYEVMEEP